MQEPLKISLPPWRRGDGKPFDKPGRYAIRCTDHEWIGEFTAWLSGGESTHPDYDYAGPIEFIEIEPEPEPIVPAGYYLRRHVGPKGTGLPLELCREYDNQLILSVFGVTWRSSVEIFNAAVRAMEGK